MQQQKARFIASDEPNLYLGVALTMDLNWKHQIQRMTGNLRNKLKALSASYASPRQILNIIRTAIIPSLAYAFAVTPCTPADLIIWDNMKCRTIKHKLKLWKSTATAMIRENISNFGLGAPSVCVEYHRRLAAALTSSLGDPSARHSNVTLDLLTKQIDHLTDLYNTFLTIREGTNLHIRRQLNYFMRARQLLSIHSSKLLLMKHREKILHSSLMKISEALSLRKPPPHTLSTLITCITQPLMSLGLNGLHDLTSPNKTHIITVAQLKEEFPKVTAKSKIALDRSAALVNLPQVEDLTPGEIHKLLAYKSTNASTFAIYRKINNTHQRTS